MIAVDTHTAIWLALEPERLSAKAAKAIQSARQVDGVAISDKTLWELAMAVSRGRLTIYTSMGDFLRTVEQTFAVLPITAAIAERAVLFSDKFPKDPSDRIIAATAIVHGLKLVTSDSKIRKSNEVDCIW